MKNEVVNVVGELMSLRACCNREDFPRLQSLNHIDRLLAIHDSEPCRCPKCKAEFEDPAPRNNPNLYDKSCMIFCPVCGHNNSPRNFLSFPAFVRQYLKKRVGARQCPKCDKLLNSHDHPSVVNDRGEFPGTAWGVYCTKCGVSSDSGSFAKYVFDVRPPKEIPPSVEEINRAKELEQAREIGRKERAELWGKALRAGYKGGEKVGFRNGQKDLKRAETRAYNEGFAAGAEHARKVPDGFKRGVGAGLRLARAVREKRSDTYAYNRGYANGWDRAQDKSSEAADAVFNRGYKAGLEQLERAKSVAYNKGLLDKAQVCKTRDEDGAVERGERDRYTFSKGFELGYGCAQSTIQGELRAFVAKILFSGSPLTVDRLEGFYRSSIFTEGKESAARFFNPRPFVSPASIPREEMINHDCGEGGTR